MIRRYAMCSLKKYYIVPVMISEFISVLLFLCECFGENSDLKKLVSLKLNLKRYMYYQYGTHVALQLHCCPCRMSWSRFSIDWVHPTAPWIHWSPSARYNPDPTYLERGIDFTAYYDVSKHRRWMMSPS